MKYMNNKKMCPKNNLCICEYNSQIQSEVYEQSSIILNNSVEWIGLNRREN